MSSLFKDLVRVGLTGLTDPSPLQTPRQWFRNGERGNLHIDRHCYKLQSWTNKQVDMTYEQAAKKKVCSHCCDNRALPPKLEIALRVLRSVETLFASFDEKLASAKFAQDLGALLEKIEQIRDEIGLLDDDRRDLVSKAIEVFESRLVQAAKDTGAVRAQITEGLVPWAASRLLLNDGLELSKAPGVQANDIALFGAARDRYSNVEHLRDVYTAWAKARRRGREKADTAAYDVLAKLELTDIAQLDFPVEHDGATSLLTLAKDRWRDEARRRLAERLIPTWDAHWLAYAAQTQMRTVGLTADINQDATRGIFDSYPHHGNIAVMPEVVALWVGRIEASYGTSTAVVAQGCDADLLQTVSVLWDHRNSSSPYQRLDEAINAAQAV